MKLCILLCFVGIAALSFQILSEKILFDLRISADRMENSKNLYPSVPIPATHPPLAQYVRITLDKSIVDCYNTEHEKTKASY